MTVERIKAKGRCPTPKITVSRTVGIAVPRGQLFNATAIRGRTYGRGYGSTKAIARKRALASYKIQCRYR